MYKFFEWVKRNWLVLVLGVAVIFLLTRSTGVQPLVNYGTADISLNSAGMMAKVANVAPSPMRQVAPTESTNRLVVTNTNLSLKVKDVAASVKAIQTETESLGGFMVESNLTVPEGATTGDITVRVPADHLKEAMDSFRGMAVKVVSEHVSGTDVTDQYVDIQSRLNTLQKTKAKFEQILDEARSVNDLLNVQQQLVNLQEQIDSWTGQQKYLEQTAKLSLVTIYLATDELALPYTPDQAWRPTVIFKEAVRSMIGSLRGIGNLVIWAAAYLPIWLPILIIALVIYRIAYKKPLTVK